MRVLVYPHDLGMGGSQLNAIELAAATREMGHDVLLYGRPGVLNGRVAELGLEFVTSPPPSHRPTPRVVRDLRRIIKMRQVEVVHGYEWPPSIEARLAVAGTRAVCVSTVMSMAVAPFIPHNVPLVVGTQQIAAAERKRGRHRVSVIEPPVDTVYNAPWPRTASKAFRSRFAIPETTFHVVCVSRLAHELKLEGILTAINVVPTMSADSVLTIVGDGPAMEEVRSAAATSNEMVGRRAVVLTGQIDDPRAAYASADVVLGMGGSALRALAFAKPLVVQGERGFWRVFDRESYTSFLWNGWYGLGPGAATGESALREQIGQLIEDRPLRDRLGRFGREIVTDRFSLDRAARRQVGVYESACSSRPSSSSRMWDDLAGLTSFVAHTTRQMRSWRRGQVASDDFNSMSELQRIQVV